MTILLIASNNPGKINEFRSLLGDNVSNKLAQLKLVTAADLNLSLDVAETMPTYAENAALKALAFHQAAEKRIDQTDALITLADDSGLEVEVLDGVPGIFSARFGSPAGSKRLDDARRRAYLLDKLQAFSQPWRACFRCAVVLAHAGKLYYANGECQGEIINEERGSNGFGYDPIFRLSEMDKTMAELSMEEKNHLSHRARAMLAALPTIEMLTDG